MEATHGTRKERKKEKKTSSNGGGSRGLLGRLQKKKAYPEGKSPQRRSLLGHGDETSHALQPETLGED